MVGDANDSAARKHIVHYDTAYAVTQVVSGLCISSTLHAVQRGTCADACQQRQGVPSCWTMMLLSTSPFTGKALYLQQLLCMLWSSGQRPQW